MRLDRPSAVVPCRVGSVEKYRVRTGSTSAAVLRLLRHFLRLQLLRPWATLLFVKNAEPVPVGSSYVRPTKATSVARLADRLTGDVNDGIGFAVPGPA
jgi:hypothetical protein